MRLLFRATLLCGLLAFLPLASQAQGTSIRAYSQRSAAAGVARRQAAHPAKSALKPATSVITVTVRASAEVGGHAFTLGEIADITGSDKAMAAQLAAVEIGTSPLPGLSRLLYPGDITVHLRASHLESKRVEVVAPPVIRVSRAGHDVAADEITRAAIAAAQAAIKDLPNATLEPVQAADKITVPAGKVQILAGAYRGSPEQGTLYVPVSLTVDGKAVQVVEIPLRVHRKAMALIANRTIEPHEILSAADVSLAPVDLPPGFTQPVVELQEAIGKRATRRLSANLPISATALETPPAISANDRITIEYAFGSIRITAPGLARQSGAIGDTIRVYAPDTQKEVDAVILNSRTVRIVDNGDSGDDSPAPETDPSTP
jgi:flagella basal body P-ring formation protein FlgA